VIWVGAIGLVAAVVLLAYPIVDFLADPGYGSFDMTSASAFDLKWLRGSVALGFGLGVVAGSLAVGVAAAIVTMFSSMLVKPVLVRAVAKRNPRKTPPLND
jgi:hypothetical protein